MFDEHDEDLRALEGLDAAVQEANACAEAFSRVVVPALRRKIDELRGGLDAQPPDAGP